MTNLAANFIKGRKDSACRNDAYAVVVVDKANDERLLGIIPAYEVEGLTVVTLLEEFDKAISDTGGAGQAALESATIARLRVRRGVQPG